jgi:hypothetical protein
MDPGVFVTYWCLEKVVCFLAFDGGAVVGSHFERLLSESAALLSPGTHSKGYTLIQLVLA